MKPTTLLVASAAVASMTVAGGSLWLVTQNPVAVVPALMLARFVYADLELLLTAALLAAAALVAAGTADSAIGAAGGLLGVFVACELAAAGGRLRRMGTPKAVPLLRAMLGQHLAVALGVVAIGLPLAVWKPPIWVTVGALAAVTCGIALVVISQILKKR